ncbi:mis6 domain-containing protein [Hirsutella rhossiliensis]|uniref:Mis6 domain-containing protein n=1 Tax=Hirsutella rhossiliensis TaxID=111463 RepID=A0A9P8N165_9HYPO|nr:mis6 domain-containing protein [Hirsutella rhossiliensis]KAH0965027.1 mis6 domain-containing protein [Hirsutella rhossiliensis]
MAPADDQDINLLVQDVVGASRIPPKARLADIKPTVARLASLAYERGLLPDALAQLVDLIAAPSLLDQASLNALVRNLYPRDKVSRNVVMRVVAALGHGALKPSLNMQAGLLRWLNMVFHVLEDRIVLARAYPVLFNLLDTAAIRPQLTQLLALVTRRRHVRPFRIQALLALSRQTGNDPWLVGLLRVFKDYYPEIIVGEAVRGKASAFKHPDIQWRARLDEIQDTHLRDAEQRSSSGPRQGFRVNRPVNRSLRHRLVPTVQTSQATEDSVTLEEIDNVTSLVQNLERLELPNQLVAVLADPLLQKLLVLRPAAESHQRVANWLGSVLRDFLDGDVDEETLWEVLEVTRDYVIQTKTFPPALLEFFARFLQLWSGSRRRDLVLDVLGRAPLHDFQELYQHIFGPLETAMLDDSPASPLALLDLYTRLLHHWTTALQSADAVPPHASQVVAQLVRHVSRLALGVLQAAPGVATESAILSFYEQTVRLVADDVLRQYIRIELPPSALVYTLLFSPSLATVSRLCHVLACYKRGFEVAMSTKARHDGSARIDALSYDRAYVNRYNGFIMDMCNCFWRTRAFSDTDTNARGCMVPRATVSALEAYVASVDRATSLASLLSLSHAPVLCLQSIRRVREMEDAAMRGDRPALRARHAGPVTQSSLAKLAAAGGIRLSWQEYRIDVLRSLSDKGLPGVTELLKNTMTVLKNSMEGKASTQGGSSQAQASQ